VTIARRLTQMEGSLEPRQIVLRILAEAREFESLEAYARSMIDLPDDASPLSRIATETEAAVRGSMKGQARETVEAAVRRAVGDGLFAFLLVLQLNGAAFEVARLESLRASALFFWMGCLLGGPRSADLEETERVVYEQELEAAWRQWTSVLGHLVGLLTIEEQARSILEARHLDGHVALFADAEAIWASLRDTVDRIVALASYRGPASPARPSRKRPGVPGSRTHAEQARERARTLADDARIRTFDLLGERRRALAILERRLTSGESQTAQLR
jgi:hypothetical protein